MSELSISGSDMLIRLEKKIDDMTSKMIELKDELHGMSQSHEARLTSVEKDVESIKRENKDGKESRKRLHERLDELERLPGKKALQDNEEAKKTARAAAIRMVVTVVLSAVAVILIIFAEKTILGL